MGCQPYRHQDSLCNCISRCSRTEHPSLQVGATCKHFAAYSLEQSDGFGRYFYDAKVTNRCASCNAIRLPVLLCCSGQLQVLSIGFCFFP